MLVAEGTFGDSADQPRAIETGHMTFAEAAGLAVASGARALLLTHFSPAMPDPLGYAVQARAVYPDAIVGYDGFQTTLRFDEG